MFRVLVACEYVWLVLLWIDECCVYCVIVVLRVLVGGECVRLVLLWVDRCCVYCVIMVFRVFGWWSVCLVGGESIY